MESIVKLDLGEITVSTFTQNLITAKYVSWLNDPLVVRYSEQRHTIHTLDSCQEYFDAIKISNNHFLAIFSKDSELGHIGNITATVDKANSTVDLSILIGDKRAWGKALGLKAWLGVQNYFLNELNFRMVTAGTMAENKAMLSVMKKSGMQVNCTRPGLMIWEGQEVDMVYASIIS